MTSVLCVAASPPREFISQVDLTFKISIVAYLYVCNLFFFKKKNKEHQIIIHSDLETGHINPGQHIGVYDPQQQQQQQELGQFPSGPRSISLQVYNTYYISSFKQSVTQSQFSCVVCSQNQTVQAGLGKQQPTEPSPLTSCKQRFA